MFEMYFRCLILLGLIFQCFSCVAHKVNATLLKESRNSGQSFWIVSEEVPVSDLMVIDKNVFIMPGGFFSAKKPATIRFNGHVDIIGQQKVFDKELAVEFAPGAFTHLNPDWFGANGMDDADDTDCFQKIFDMISSGGAIQVRVPIGKYYISRQLKLGGQPGNNLSLIIQGASTSYSGTKGSSILWRGKPSESMVLISNTSQTVIENLDFDCVPNHYLMSNIELRPSCNQITFSNCYFSGCAGELSTNINLNEGNSLQVSELFFNNCIFKGIFLAEKITDNAVRGGWANTKNFQFTQCAFGPYRNEAIKIKTSDVLKVDGCTFYLNDVDISCETCKTIATDNYSEESQAFFMSTASANFNATTLINNQFTGKPKDGFVIRDGSGTLILMNNNFGAGNYLPDKNYVRWEENDYNSIYSVGNVYKNTDEKEGPFYNRSNRNYRQDRIFSWGDLGGVLGEGRVKLKDTQH